MRNTLLALLLAFSLSCPAWAGESEAPVAAAPAPAASVESPAPTTDAPATEKAPETASSADSEAAESQGFLDKVLAILKSTEAIIGSLIVILTTLGLAVKLVAKLKKVREALNTVATKIEEQRKKGDHKAAANKLATDISKAIPQGTPVGAIVHAAAKEAERRVNGT